MKARKVGNLFYESVKFCSEYERSEIEYQQKLKSIGGSGRRSKVQISRQVPESTLAIVKETFTISTNKYYMKSLISFHQSLVNNILDRYELEAGTERKWFLQQNLCFRRFLWFLRFSQHFHLLASSPITSPDFPVNPLLRIFHYLRRFGFFI